MVNKSKKRQKKYTFFVGMLVIIVFTSVFIYWMIQSIEKEKILLKEIPLVNKAYYILVYIIFRLLVHFMIYLLLYSQTYS